jgi:AcrR family transcriptional regulator
VTRTRLIEAAETLFIRKGFDDTSVDEISEMAGYSRGAFYSNFENKEQVLLLLIDRRRPQVPKALDGIFQQISGPERIAAVREWYSNQWRRNDLIALRTEFSRRATRDRSVRKHLAELWRQELETYADSVGRYLRVTDVVPADRPEVVALVLLAVAHGLGTLAIDMGPEWEQTYTEAARLAFDRMTTTQIS